MKTIKLTEKQLNVLHYIVLTQIQWREGGCLGDGETINKKGMNTAKKILGKLSKSILNK